MKRSGEGLFQWMAIFHFFSHPLPPALYDFVALNVSGITIGHTDGGEQLCHAMTQLAQECDTAPAVEPRFEPKLHQLVEMANSAANWTKRKRKERKKAKRRQKEMLLRQ